MLKHWVKLRKAVGSIIAILFIIGAIIIAFTIVEYNIVSQGRLREIQEKRTESERESIALAKSVEGYWYFDNLTSELEVYITNNYNQPVGITGIVIYYNDKNYTCLKNNVYENLQPSNTKILGFGVIKGNTWVEESNLPVWLFPGETLAIRMYTEGRNPVSISFSTSSATAIASSSATQYRPLLANVTQPVVNYEVKYIPTTIPEGAVTTLGYSTYSRKGTPVTVETFKGSYIGGDLESIKKNDSDYYVVESSKIPRTDWLTGWNYRRPIVIRERSGNSLENYPVRIELNSSNFDFSKAKSDGSDIRFTLDDGVSEIPFYIEEWDKVSERAIVWVKINKLPGDGEVKIYMYYGNPAASLPDYATVENVFALVGEANTVNTDENIAKVLFQGNYSEPPIVFASIMTFNEGDTVVSRVVERTNTYFEVRLEEYPRNDGPHAVETVGWVALKPGMWVIGDTIWEVGVVQATHVYTTVNFDHSFSGIPIIITYINSYNEGGFSGTPEAGAHTRQRDASNTGFQVKVEEETDTSHTFEDIGYLAIQWNKYKRERWWTPSFPYFIYVDVYYVIGETKNKLKFEAARLYPYYYWYINNDGWEPSYWRRYYFHASFPNLPVVVFKIQSERGGDNCHERLRNVGTSTFDFGLQETPAHDGWHTYEWGGFIAIEPGLIYGYEYVDPSPTYSIGLEENPYTYVSEVHIIFKDVSAEAIMLNIETVLMFNSSPTELSILLWNYGENRWDTVFNTVCDQANVERTYSSALADGRYIRNSNVNISIYAESNMPHRMFLDYVSINYTVLKSTVIYVGILGSKTLLQYNVSNGASKVLSSDFTFTNPSSICFDVNYGRIWAINSTHFAYYIIANNTWKFVNKMPGTPIGEGVFLLHSENYPDYVFLIVGGGSNEVWYFDVKSNSWYVLSSEIKEGVGAYSVAEVTGDTIYVIVGGGSLGFYKGEIHSLLSGGEWVKLNDSPTSYAVGLAYDPDRNVLWLIGRGGGIHYYVIAENAWHPLVNQIPYVPIAPGNRLEYYRDKLYHVRGDGTRELWIIHVR